ncbi:MAG: hypothetical protein V4569_19860 [Pseudomonadota bacterium]
MARFQFSLRSFTRADGNAVVVSQRTLRALHLDDASDTQEIVQGPGWFDSSWELVHGLDVREGMPGDARLDDWLDACARGVAAVTRAVRVDVLRVDDLDLAAAVAAAEAAPRDAFERFGIAGLTLA